MTTNTERALQDLTVHLVSYNADMGSRVLGGGGTVRRPNIDEYLTKYGCIPIAPGIWDWETHSVIGFLTKCLGRTPRTWVLSNSRLWFETEELAEFCAFYTGTKA